MLIAAGQELINLRDFTSYIAAESVQIHAVQGDPVDTCQFDLRDRLSNNPLACDDDLVVLDEADPSGWPTVNLLLNPGLEGTYTAGIPASWTLLGGSTSSGFTLGKATVNLIARSAAAAAITINGAAVNSYSGYQQKIALAHDENNQYLTDFLYYFSGWCLYTGTDGSFQAELRLTWLNALGNAMYDDTLPIPTVTAADGVWQRYTLVRLPPVGAHFVIAKVYARALSAGNTGSVTWDNLQFERATFSDRPSLIYPLQIPNPLFSDSSGGGCLDGWFRDVVAGVSYQTVTSPALFRTAQRIAISGLNSSSYGITLPGIHFNPFQTYIVNVNYQVTQALSNAQTLMLVTARDSTGTAIASYGATGPANQGVTGWQTLIARIGPDHGQITMPAQAMTLDIAVKIQTLGTGAVGTIVFGSLVTAPDDPAPSLTFANTVQTALQAGMYPTPFVGYAGDYLDTDRTALYYRQTRFFGGYIRDIKTKYKSVERILTIKATEYGCILDEAPFTGVISATSDILAIQRAVTYAKNQGYLAGLDATRFVTGIENVDGLSFTFATTKDVLTEIADATVAAFYVDAHKCLHYHDALIVASPFALSDQPDNINSFPYSDWEYESDSTQSITVSTIEGGQQVSAPQTYQITGDGTTTLWNINSGFPVVSLDNVTIGGTGQKIGLANRDTFAVGGYTVLADLDKGTLLLRTAAASGVAIVYVFRFNATLLTRLHSAQSEAFYGTGPRRKIHQHSTHQHIISQGTALRRARADLAQFQKAHPVASCIVTTPNAPIGVPLSVGEAIYITHQQSGLNHAPFQITEVTTHFRGNGVCQRLLKMGHYQQDAIRMLANSRREAMQQGTATNADAALDDILDTYDGWTINDGATARVLNVATWSGTSTWGGAFVWG